MAVAWNFPSAGPTAPDFDFCEKAYGHPLLTDCQAAAALLPRGSEEVEYIWFGPGNSEDPFELPAVLTVGTCQLTLYDGGSSSTPSDPFLIAPDAIRNMAGGIIKKCVDGLTAVPLGGYITSNISNVVEYITDPSTNIDVPLPKGVTFLILSVSTPQAVSELASPGDYHPYTGSILSIIVLLKWLNTPAGSAADAFLAVIARKLYQNLQAMVVGGRRAWWRN